MFFDHKSTRGAGMSGRGVPNAGEQAAWFICNVLPRARTQKKMQAFMDEPRAYYGQRPIMHARYFDLSLLGWEPDNATSRMTAEAPHPSLRPARRRLPQGQARTRARTAERRSAARRRHSGRTG